MSQKIECCEGWLNLTASRANQYRDIVISLIDLFRYRLEKSIYGVIADITNKVDYYWLWGSWIARCRLAEHCASDKNTKARIANDKRRSHILSLPTWKAKQSLGATLLIHYTPVAERVQ